MGVYCWNYYCYYCIYLGGRVKNLMFYKMCEKKIHFCLVGDFPMTHQIKGSKWVILYSDSTVDSFYYEIVLVVTKPWLLYWLLNHKRVCCAQRTCAGWVYIFGGRVKNLML